MDSKTYKGISGGFGSYAQRGGKASMLRLRMPGGVMTKEKLGFIAQAVKDYKISRVDSSPPARPCSFTIYPKTMYVNWQ